MDFQNILKAGNIDKKGNIYKQLSECQLFNFDDYCLYNSKYDYKDNWKIRLDTDPSSEDDTYFFYSYIDDSFYADPSLIRGFNNVFESIEIVEKFIKTGRKHEIIQKIKNRKTT